MARTRRTKSLRIRENFPTVRAFDSFAAPLPDGRNFLLTAGRTEPEELRRLDHRAAARYGPVTVGGGEPGRGRGGLGTDRGGARKEDGKEEVGSDRGARKRNTRAPAITSPFTQPKVDTRTASAIIHVADPPNITVTRRFDS